MQVCTDPRVAVAAGKVLTNIISGCYDPRYMPALANAARRSLRGQNIMVMADSALNFGLPAGQGLAWLTRRDGRVFLLVPDFQDGEGLGWVQDPLVVLVNDASPDEAVEVLAELANGLANV